MSNLFLICIFGNPLFTFGMIHEVPLWIYNNLCDNQPVSYGGEGCHGKITELLSIHRPLLKPGYARGLDEADPAADRNLR